VQRGNTPSFAEGVIATLDWAQQRRIAVASEAAGMDAIIPIGRWKGIQGKSQLWCESYETVAWAAALAEATRRVTVFSTVHVPLLHPVRAAKSAVTIDHISGGRFGFNIVSGWNEAEFKMFGKPQRPHDERYAESAEWVRFVEKLWTEKSEFDWAGKYYQATAAISEPVPLGPRPVLMSAGSSPAGRVFAAEFADIVFISAPNLELVRKASAELKGMAARHGREIQIWIEAGVLCCETEKEARRQYNYLVNEKGDWETAEHLVKGFLSGGGQSIDGMDRNVIIEGIIAGTRGHQLLGSPEQVTEKMVELSDAGVDGLALVWFDYESGLETFREAVRPVAVRAGLLE